MQKCNANGDSLNGFETSQSNQRFEIVKELDDDFVVIRVLNYGSRPPRKKFPLHKQYKNEYVENVPYNIFEKVTTEEVKADSTKIVKTVEITRDDNGVMQRDEKIEQFKLTELDTNQNQLDTLISVKTGFKNVPSSHYKFLPSSNFFKYNFDGSEQEFHALPNGQRNAKNFGDYQIYFKVAKSTIDKHTYYKEGASLAFGVINFPFKARFNPISDFSGSFNFGTAVGLRFAKKNFRNWTFSIIAGQSISNVSLDNASVAKNSHLLVDNNDFSALTLSIGPLIAYNNVQIGLFVGRDMLTRQNQSTFNWTYNKEPWFSVGLGYAIFSTSGKKKNNENQTIQKNE